MGQGMSAQEREVFELMTKLLQQHGKYLPSHNLKALLRWTAAKLPGVTESTIFMIVLWDKVEVKLWDCATKGNKTVAEMLPSWRVIFEVLKAQENIYDKDKGDASCLPFAVEPQSSLRSGMTASLSTQPTAPPLRSERERGPLRSLGAFAAGYCPNDSDSDGEYPFNSGPVDPEKEPDLCPPAWCLPGAMDVTVAAAAAGGAALLPSAGQHGHSLHSMLKL
ncbi:hypothetical protein DUI87_19054 [Hirundo rustica rustica]|uniref:Uncharacterized protein n=1 Tax=Hirundo rustica rustica TaxID=333673 RepID=A0A3M0JU37_HIRRU|nr:hypothetical protein DUI87_19054 [Hirundo rustica rustica]